MGSPEEVEVVIPLVDLGRLLIKLFHRKKFKLLRSRRIYMNRKLLVIDY